MFTRGFRGRQSQPEGDRLPPGQHLTSGFPVLSAGPTPLTEPLDSWTFALQAEDGTTLASWSWEDLKALAPTEVTVDIHCVTRWSKRNTDWQGVSLDTLLEGIDTGAHHAQAHSYGGYTTNLPLTDLRGGRAWVAHRYDGGPLPAEHGGPARLLVPHLYFWKSAKWVRGIRLTAEDQPGFWETAGYHDYGDPWREQRYQGD
jgi:DMSO/TMAO reductase YedYZ molybdopterin-dependent catalytic subunit